MGLNISSMVKSFLPQLGKIAGSPVIKQILGDILKSVGSSMFDSTGKGIFSDTIQVNTRIPNPLKALEKKLLGKLPEWAKGLISKGLQALLGKLTGNRDIGGSTPVTVPSLTDRAPAAAAQMNQAASSVQGGAASFGTNTNVNAYNDIRGQVGGPTGGRSEFDSLLGAGASARDQADKITGDKEEDLIKKQELMQKAARIFQAITAMLQMKHQSSMSILQNIR